MARINRKVVGRESEVGINEVEKGAIRRFCEAVGELDPVHFDEQAAKAAGFKGIVAPLTFPITFRPGSDVREGIGLDYKNLLHAEQEFEYFRPVIAGDVIYVKSTITDLSEKTASNGTMQFLVIDDEGIDGKQQPVYRARKKLAIFVK